MENKNKFFERLRFKIAPQLIQTIETAYEFSKYGHRGQERDGGIRYFEHPRRVALITIDELGIYDHEAVIAALLHDISEDSYILSWQGIQHNFGNRVLSFIKLLTKSKGQSLEEYLRALQASEEIVQILKLTDRLDNIRDLNGCTEAKAKKQLRETVKHFIPWAKELGDKSMKSQNIDRGWSPQYKLYSLLKVAYSQGYAKVYNPTGT